MSLPIALTYCILDCKLEQTLRVWAVFLIDETKLKDVFLQQSLFSWLLKGMQPHRNRVKLVLNKYPWKQVQSKYGECSTNNFTF